ncbi:MAG: hypothetical protein U0744_04365 [Gemmataceae bacterium]
MPEAEEAVDIDDDAVRRGETEEPVDVKKITDLLAEGRFVREVHQLREFDEPAFLLLRRLAFRVVLFLIRGPLFAEVHQSLNFLGLQQHALIGAEMFAEKRFVHGFDQGVDAEEDVVMFRRRGELHADERRARSGRLRGAEDGVAQRFANAAWVEVVVAESKRTKSEDFLIVVVAVDVDFERTPQAVFRRLIGGIAFEASGHFLDDLPFEIDVGLHPGKLGAEGFAFVNVRGRSVLRFRLFDLRRFLFREAETKRVERILLRLHRLPCVGADAEVERPQFVGAEDFGALARCLCGCSRGGEKACRANEKKADHRSLV